MDTEQTPTREGRNRGRRSDDKERKRENQVVSSTSQIWPTSGECGQALDARCVGITQLLLVSLRPRWVTTHVNAIPQSTRLAKQPLARTTGGHRLFLTAGSDQEGLQNVMEKRASSRKLASLPPLLTTPGFAQSLWRTPLKPADERCRISLCRLHRFSPKSML